MCSKSGCKCLTLVLWISEVYSDGRPFLPDNVRRRPCNLFGGEMPCGIFGRQSIVTIYIITVEIRLTTTTNALSIDKQIQFESWIFIVLVSRSLDNGSIIEQEHRRFDGIYHKGEFDTLCFISTFNISQTYGCQFPFRHCFEQSSSTWVCFQLVVVHRMPAG